MMQVYTKQRARRLAVYVTGEQFSLLPEGTVLLMTELNVAVFVAAFAE